MAQSNASNQEGREYLSAYSALAPYYEKLNADVDYGAWAEFLLRKITQHSAKKPELYLELACGTGAVTRELARRGCEMIGIDISSEMLAEAMRAEYESEDGDSTSRPCHRRSPRPLYLCQDIRSFELYGTVQAAVCCLDGINYLTEDGDLEKCFTTLHNYLESGGIFIFDVNTPHKFENVFGDRDYILESEDALCAWQNCFDRESSLCEFRLSVFTRSGASWRRLDEIQVERCRTMQEISDALRSCGFELLETLGGMDGTPASDTDERWFFVTRRT